MTSKLRLWGVALLTAVAASHASAQTYAALDVLPTYHSGLYYLYADMSAAGQGGASPVLAVASYGEPITAPEPIYMSEDEYLELEAQGKHWNAKLWHEKGLRSGSWQRQHVRTSLI
ncbi:hypothetical protein [Saezia sanguinis]|uniref:hypothetical protein n=1 Tax=Saezia sanguinis TaxID=1965230 RepID=UPI00304DF22C